MSSNWLTTIAVQKKVIYFLWGGFKWCHRCGSRKINETTNRYLKYVTWLATYLRAPKISKYSYNNITIESPSVKNCRYVSMQVLCGCPTFLYEAHMNLAKFKIYMFMHNSYVRLVCSSKYIFFYSNAREHICLHIIFMW